MASNIQHCDHAFENFQFLENICTQFPTSEYRWKVTVAFYTAVQLINGYLESKLTLHPKDHNERKMHINPISGVSGIKLNSDLYTTYCHLENTSRNARYESQMNFREKHVIESIDDLNKIIAFYCGEFPSTKIHKINLECTEKAHVRQLEYFEIQLNPDFL